MDTSDEVEKTIFRSIVNTAPFGFVQYENVCDHNYELK